jgi:hypothetical protein
VSGEFRTALIEHAKKSVAASAHCRTEEAAKIALVLPFIGFLGYDTSDPSEVTPEHAADFSDKYKNRVDFAIMQDGVPVIAIECKGVGTSRVDDRGQLKSYFNAARTVKLGALSDGIQWEFYADSDDPNLMDDTAFLVLDLRKAADGQISDQVIEGLQQLQKGAFNPENIGAEAKRKLLFQSFVEQIGELMNAPSDAVTRLLLAGAGIKNVRAANMPGYQDLAKLAFKAATDTSILARLEIKAPVKPPPAEPLLAVEPKPSEQEGPSAGAIQVFEMLSRRLAFLSESEAEYAAIEKLEMRAYQSKTIFFVGGERKGRIAELAEAGSEWRFTVADQVIVTKDIAQLDKILLPVFQSKVSG